MGFSFLALNMAIHLNEVLQQMQMVDRNGDPQPFELTYWSCSLTDNTGGELKHIKHAILSKNDKSFKRIAQGNPGKKRLNEFKNMRRNLIDLDAHDRQFRSVHIRLIDTFNGVVVDW